MRIPKFHGTKTIFWVGVVEERDDSKAEDKLRLGRVRVRVLGFHSEQTVENDSTGEGIPVNQLHWAFPISPINTANVNGIGQSPLGVVEGSWVVGLSMDGPPMQELFILGTLPGVPKKRLTPNNQGFCDPNNKYPKDEFLGESDVNRLARVQKVSQTCVTTKRGQEERAVPKAGGGIWKEPATPYAAKYPFNHVRESESGHIEEWDDTEGKERIHTRHTKGTFTEWHPNGDEVHKVIGDGYEVTFKDRNMYVKGDLNITVLGDAKILSLGSIKMEAKKNIELKALGEIKIHAVKGIKLTTPKKVSILGIFGFSAKAITGKASVASPVNKGKGIAKAVG